MLHRFYNFQPEMHIQIQKDYFETHFRNLSDEFDFQNSFYEKIIPRHHLKVEWEKHECKLSILLQSRN